MTCRVAPYFEALVRSAGRTVQVTQICEPEGQVVALAVTPIIDGAFIVVGSDAGSASDQRFYREVKAVRSDVEPLVVEPDKGVPMIAPLTPPKANSAALTNAAPNGAKVSR
jgi:hypothetical protein